MQNIAFRTPSVFRVIDATGAFTDTPTSGRIIRRTQTGFTGKRVRSVPPPINNYVLDSEDFRLEASGYSQNLVTGKLTSSFAGPTLVASTSGTVTLFPQPNYDLAYSQVVSKLNDKVRGDLDLIVDIAEAGKTAKMLKLCDRFLFVFREAVRKGSRKYSNLGNELINFTKTKQLGKAWLEMQYGWKPLLGSIYGLAEENVRVVINRTESFRARVSLPYKPETITFPTYAGNITYPVASSDMKVSCTIGARIMHPSFEYDRFTSLNPYGLAWELMPYSFIVDWFLNVGGYLRDLETAVVYDNRFVTGYRTFLSAGSLTVRKGVITRTPTAVSSRLDTGYYERTHIDRVRLTSYPAPRLPTFNAKLGSSRLLTTAALLAQMLGRR